MLHKMIRIFCYRIKKETLCIRSFLLCIMLYVYIYTILQPIKEFVENVKVSPTVWIFPYMVNDYLTQLIFVIGGVFLFSTAPFEDEMKKYIEARTGRFSWNSGNILYIILMSFLYVIFLFFSSILFLLPHIQWSMEWGKVWNTIAKNGSITRGYNFNLSISEYLMGVYSPLKATVMTIFLEWACMAWLGLMIYFFNNKYNKKIGNLIAAMIVLLDVMIYNAGSPWAYHFSPVTLSKLTTFVTYNIYYGVTLKYAVQFYAITIPIWIILIILSGKWKGRKMFYGRKYNRDPKCE